MGTLTKITDSLLDFESSIAAEMEASLITGKQLNFNKARELALQGDIAGAAKDVMNQVGGAAEFQRMNVIQRRALAASIGVSVEEMSKLASGKLEIKDDKTDEEKLKDANNANTDQLGKSISAMGKLTYAVIALTTVMAAGALVKFFKGGGFKDMFSKMGNSKLNPMNIGRKKALDGSFKGSSKGTMSKAFTKVKNIKMPKLGVIDKGKTALDAVKGTGRGALESVKNIRMPKLDLMSKVSNALDAVKGVGKTGAKGLGKVGLKKIPLLGLLASGVFAAGRAMKGDFGGAGLELASGAAGTIPGVGTAASMGIDATLMARDMAKTKQPQTGPMQGPPLPPDELTSVQKAQAAIAEKQKAFEAEEEKKLIAERERIEKERQATLAAERAILEQEKQLMELKTQLEQARTNEVVANNIRNRRSEGDVSDRDRSIINMQENIISQSRRDQERLIAAITKLTETTANLKND
jgi:hypothetical protein